MDDPKDLFLCKFGQRLTTVLSERNLTPKRLASKMGVDIQTVTNWTLGLNGCSLFTFRELCAVLQCSPGYLLGMEDNLNK